MTHSLRVLPATTQIYKSDEMVFRCYSCATDPTCCVCSRCFEGSDCVAKGHQYQIFRAGAGGCCDCGDAEAWDPAGFCKRHSGPAVEDPIPTLPADLRAVAEELLPIVLKFSTRAMRREQGEFGGEKGKFVVYLHNDAVHSFDEVERAVKKALRCSSSESKRLTRKAHDDGHTMILQSEVEAESRAAYNELAAAGLICNITNEGYLEFEKRAAELFLLLRDISGGSNGLRRIMCNFLMEKDPIYSEKEGVKEGRGRYVDELMKADDNTWHDVQLALHDFHIQMIAEETYKNTFGDVFVELYSDLMFEVVNSRTEGNVSLLDLSVQIFTVYSNLNLVSLICLPPAPPPPSTPFRILFVADVNSLPSPSSALDRSTRLSRGWLARIISSKSSSTSSTQSSTKSNRPRAKI